MVIIVIMITTVIMGGIIWFGFCLAKAQNCALDNCFRAKRLHDELLIGKTSIEDVPDSDLLLLRSPILTTIGMGSMGPTFFPSYDVLNLVYGKMARNRENEWNAM